MTSMAFSLILSARWRIVDHLMGGPDKSYACHRWLGLFALAGALGHWGLAESVGSGVLPFLATGGETVGTIAATGLIALTAMALIRAIPYHLWKATHMLMGPIFLLACYHTFFVASPLDVGAAPWTMMAVMSALGLLAWGQTLRRKSMPTLLVTVERAEPFEGGIDVLFRSKKPLARFHPGQFATIAHNHARSETHPFTIAGGDATSRRFLIRAAGDWTERFVQTVKPGDQFRIGAGVGRFRPQHHRSRKEQIWVAGGVGITPFLATLEKMQPDNGARVTLVYCIKSRSSAGGIEDVENHSIRLPQLDLIIFDESEGNRLTPYQMTEILRGLSARTVAYLCGPEGLKALLKQAWQTLGMTGQIHGERFDFRNAYSVSDLIYVGKPVWRAARHWAINERKIPDAPVGSRG